MTSEQLQATRATLWRQKGEPLLTLEDARTWIEQIGFCFFLPRKAQISAPAPSFVEACLGETNPAPPRPAIENAKNLFARLIESNLALPLNLLGIPADAPDFLVSHETLPFVYALRGDRDWKHAPGSAGTSRVSPLVANIWKLLERRGVLTANEIQEELGKELTEAAVLRGLHELWASLRVVPLYRSGGEETGWEPLQSRHRNAIVSGLAMSQVTALSVLASVYLQSVVAASSDEAEAFLSPLASRSKVREVVRGLTATRQLALIQMETHSLLYVEGSLPEFPEAEKAAPGLLGPMAKSAILRPPPAFPARMEAALRGGVGSLPRPAYKRPAAAPGANSRKREAESVRPTAGKARPFRPVAAPIARTAPGTGLRPDGTPKKTRWRDLPGGRPDQKGKPARFGPRKVEPTSDAAPNFAVRRESREFRTPAGTKPPYKKSSATKENYRPGYGGARDRENAGRKSAGYSAGRPSFRPSGDRPATRSRPPFRPAGKGFAAPSEGGRPYAGRPARPSTSEKPGGVRKFTPRPLRAEGFTPARPRGGESRPYSPRPTGRPSTPVPGRPASGFKRSAGARPFDRSGSRTTGDGSKPGKPPEASSYRPARPGERPPYRGAARPGFGQSPRPGAGRPSFGPAKSGSRGGGKTNGPAKFKKRRDPAAESPE